MVSDAHDVVTQKRFLLLDFRQEHPQHVSRSEANRDGCRIRVTGMFFRRRSLNAKDAPRAVIGAHTGDAEASISFMFADNLDTGRRALHCQAASGVAASTLFHTSSRSLPRGQPDQYRKAGHS